MTFISFWHIIILTEPRTPLYNAYHARSFNYQDNLRMVKKHQEPLGVLQQVENLKNLGLKIDDEERAIEFLNNVSYFRLIKAFGIKEKNSNFPEGITFENIKGLYIFNAKLRHLLFAQLEKVEVNLRCRIANYFSCKYGIFGYKDANNFRAPEYHAKFLADIEIEIKRNNKAAFVRNFKDNYEGGDLPFYALVELFSFGMLSKFFKNMKNSDKKEIAKSYGIGYTFLESWFEHLAFVRNICAHYGRLYNSNLSISPILYKQYTKLGVSSLRVFASLICLKHLLPNDEHWQKFIVKVSLLVEDFPCVNPAFMGFPDKDWEIILSKSIEELN